jgi:hypothetical protein
LRPNARIWPEPQGMMQPGLFEPMRVPALRPIVLLRLV